MVREPREPAKASRSRQCSKYLVCDKFLNGKFNFIVADIIVDILDVQYTRSFVACNGIKIAPSTVCTIRKSLYKVTTGEKPIVILY